MAWPLLPLRALLLFYFVTLHASSSTQEDYWKMMLPKVPMPQAIRDNLLHSSVNVKGKAASGFDKEMMATTPNQPYTVFSSWRYKADDKEKAVTTQPSDKNKVVRATMTNQPYTVLLWRYKADDKEHATTTQPLTNGGQQYIENGAKHQHHLRSTDGSNEEHDLSIHRKDHEDMIGGSVFFKEKDLHVGAKLRHDFQKRENVPFVPSDMSIPFSVDKLPEILNRLSINPESVEATIVKETLTECLERPRVKMENRTCAPSLEAMVKFVLQELGTNEMRVTMMKNVDRIPSGFNEYEVKRLRKLPTRGEAMVTCHRMNYPYAVYYCHHQKDIGQYAVTLVGPKGVTVETSALCHYDTYAWQPDVPALRYLNIRPGDSPVCHFAGATDISWTSKT